MATELNQENAAVNEAQETEVKTFTQEEVNAMIDKRFARQWEKYGNLDDLKAKADKLDEIEAANKSELQKATERATALETELNALKKTNQVRELRDKVAKETGVPAHLLTADTEEGCNEQAKAILSFAQPSGYPAVKDAGEVTKKTKQTAQDSFSEWFKSVQK